MASVHSKNLEIFNATNFIRGLSQSSSSNVYFTFGRTIPWSTETVLAYTEDDVQNWYDAIQSVGALQVNDQIVRQKLNIPTIVEQLNNGDISPEEVQLNMINEPFTRDIVYPVIREYLGALLRYPEDEGLSYWVEQLGNKQVRINAGSETEEFVLSLFKKLFLRDPRDTGDQGLQYYIDQINSGVMTRRQVLRDLLCSMEYYGINNTFSKLINSLYVNLLNRLPEQAGYDYWLSELNSGKNRKDVIDLFLDASEFNVPYIADFILNGISPEMSDTVFVKNLYNKLYLRPALTAEANEHLDYLASGGQRIEVLRGLLKQEEYYNLNNTNVKFVTALYANLLNRLPDHDGMIYWTDYYGAGENREEMVDAFLADNEFTTTADKNLILGRNVSLFDDTLTHQFTGSKEFVDLFKIDGSHAATTEFVAKLYLNLFKYSATDENLRYWTSYNYTTEQVVNYFVQDQYFKNITSIDIKNFLLSRIRSNIPTGDLKTVRAREVSPPAPDTSVLSYVSYWKNLIGGKKITGNDVALCIPRYNWTFGAVYQAYSDIVDSNDGQNYYVLTDDFNVYKCLYNNKGAPSVAKPTLTLTGETFQTADKYIWKYMYSISSQDQLKFTTSEFIPVKTLTIQDGSSQWEVQNNSIDGAIHVCNVATGGAGYTTDDIYVRIIGNGYAANAFAIRDAATATISEIVIDNEGYGYTRANVYIVSGNGVGAMARAVISPPGGHGSDPVSELGAAYVMISARLNGTEMNQFSVSNDYRQIGILQDPVRKSTGRAYGNLLFSQVTTTIVTGQNVNYQNDEYVYQGNSFTESKFRGTVFDWTPESNQLQLIGTDGSVETNEKIIGYTTGASRTLISVSVQPDLQYNSGKLLYIDNIQPIQRDASQSEEFKIVLRF